jgi:hypothetical protein
MKAPWNHIYWKWTEIYFIVPSWIERGDKSNLKWHSVQGLWWDIKWCVLIIRRMLTYLWLIYVLFTTLPLISIVCFYLFCFRDIYIGCDWVELEANVSVSCGKSMIFSGYLSLIHLWNWPTWYNWNMLKAVLHINGIT